MSWMETDNDDTWLTEEPIANVNTSSFPVGNTSGEVVSETVLDLTDAVSVAEPLHSLPEAPKCLILQSVRDLSTIQNTGVFRVPVQMAVELNTTLASSSFVVFIFSLVGVYTFDGYALLLGTSGTLDLSSRFVSVRVQFIRRGVVSFSQVAHIRDEHALKGRPISSAKDGMRLGLSAGRALCRGIDKTSYRDDPIHYRDEKYAPRILHEKKIPSQTTLAKAETDFLQMSYSEYLDYVNKKNPTDIVPSLAQCSLYK